MKTLTQRIVGTRRRVCGFFSAGVVLWGLTVSVATAGGDSSLGEKTKEVANKATSAVQAATSSATEKLKDLWRQLDPSRLEHRTRDELVAWALMGLLAGAMAATMVGSKPTSLGKFGRLVFGLIGGCLGGLVIHFGKFDFGWGPVLIRYEELCFALGGAIIVILAGMILRSRSKKSSSSDSKPRPAST